MDDHWISFKWLTKHRIGIRQDDPLDWEEAVAAMDDIYENAFFTISALVGQGSNDGLRPESDDYYDPKNLPNSDFYIRELRLEYPDTSIGSSKHNSIHRSYYPF